MDKVLVPTVKQAYSRLMEINYQLKWGVFVDDGGWQEWEREKLVCQHVISVIPTSWLSYSS